MTITQGKQQTKQLAKKKILEKRSEMELAKLEYQRALKSASQTLTQTEIASTAGVSQPSISDALKTAAKVEECKEGFSGGSVHEIILRYNAGQLPKAKLVEELSSWEYEKPGVADSLDGLLVDLPNTFREVESALLKGMIDSDIYDAVLACLGKRKSTK